MNECMHLRASTCERRFGFLISPHHSASPDQLADTTTPSDAPLDKAQLRFAFLALMEDDAFLEMLHQKYLDACSAAAANK